MKRIFICLMLTALFWQTGHAQGFHYNGTKQDIVIDVRSAAEFSAGHIDGAINIPYNEIGDGIKKLGNISNKSRILVYCRSGRRSDIALNKLMQEGYQRVTNGGGYRQLQGLIKPCETLQC